MKLTAIATAAFALAIAAPAWPAAAQDKAPGPENAQQKAQEQMQNSTGMRLEGELPEGSLAEKRAGAIGQQPDTVRQGGADTGQTEEQAVAPEGEAPEGTLMQRRTGAIGENPKPVIQGGADSSKPDPSKQ